MNFNKIIDYIGFIITILCISLIIFYGVAIGLVTFLILTSVMGIVVLIRRRKEYVEVVKYMEKRIFQNGKPKK